MILGFLLFALLCGVGAIANVNIASWLFHANSTWWLAGLAGALVGVVWNYAASTTFVWRRRSRKRRAAAVASAAG
jgi:dolichol-phosphate mannosyltransferase